MAIIYYFRMNGFIHSSDISNSRFKFCSTADTETFAYFNRIEFCNFQMITIHIMDCRGKNSTHDIQDIPLLDKQMILLLFTRKMFCKNPGCEHKTFSEPFDFVAPNGKKTKRLVKRILITSIKMSSVSASYLLKTETVQAGKSSICDLLKKNAWDCG